MIQMLSNSCFSCLW